MTTAPVIDRKAEYLAASSAPGRPPHADMVWIPGGAFLMGSEQFYEHRRDKGPVDVDRRDGRHLRASGPRASRAERGRARRGIPGGDGAWRRRRNTGVSRLPASRRVPSRPTGCRSVP